MRKRNVKNSHLTSFANFLTIPANCTALYVSQKPSGDATRTNVGRLKMKKEATLPRNHKEKRAILLSLAILLGFHANLHVLFKS